MTENNAEGSPLLGKRRKVLLWACLTVILIAGAWLRISRAVTAELNGDEAWRALLISPRTWIQDTLAWNRSTPNPILFMGLSRVSALVLSNREITLRLPGLLLSLAGLVLIFILVRMAAGDGAALAAAFLLALHSDLITFGAMLKPYSGEVFATLCLICLAERILERKTAWAWAAFGAVAAIAVFLATSIVFVYPGVLLVLLWREWRARRAFPIRAAAVSLAAAAATFINFVVFIKAGQRANLIAALGDFFPPRAGVGSTLVWYLSKTAALFPAFVFHPQGWAGRELAVVQTGLGLALAVLGCAYFLRSSKGRFLVYLFLPVLVQTVFAWFRLWPFGPMRANLFLAPALMIAVAAGAGEAWTLASRSGWLRVTAAGLAIVLLTLSLPVRPPTGFNRESRSLRTGIGRCLRACRAEDVIVAVFCLPILRYYLYHYAPFRPLRHRIPAVGQVTYRGVSRARWPAYLKRRAAGYLDKHRRVWIVIQSGPVRSRYSGDVLSVFRRRGKERLSWGDRLGGVYLYESNGGRPARPPQRKKAKLLNGASSGRPGRCG